jgi:hypothetical protein
MSRIILLDTGPLGYVTHPNDKGDIGLCKQWLEQLRAANVIVKVPQIADYELRRKLIHMHFAPSIALLNKLIRSTGGLVRISVKTMQKAAELWAQSRWDAKTTGKDEAIDGDMILCAQAFLLAKKGDTVEVATTNLKHLEHYSTAKIWSDISV